MKIGNLNLTPIQIGIVLTTVATAIIHFVLAFPSITSPFGILFILNGLGYLGLLAALLLPIPALMPQKKLIRWVFIGFTALTIILFFVFNASSGYGPLGLITKAIELALVMLLYLDR